MELRYNMKDSGYLEHYGVLGMKWGVRKPESAARLSREDVKQKKRTKRLNNEIRLARELRKPGSTSISTKKLKEIKKSQRIGQIMNVVKVGMTAKKLYSGSIGVMSLVEAGTMFTPAGAAALAGLGLTAVGGYMATKKIRNSTTRISDINNAIKKRGD